MAATTGITKEKSCIKMKKLFNRCIIKRDIFMIDQLEAYEDKQQSYCSSCLNFLY